MEGLETPRSIMSPGHLNSVIVMQYAQREFIGNRQSGSCAIDCCFSFILHLEKHTSMLLRHPDKEIHCSMKKRINWMFIETMCQVEKERTTQAAKKHFPHKLRKRSHFGTGCHKAPPPRKEKGKSMGIRRVAGLAWNRLLMRVDNSTGKGMSSMDKINSKVHKVRMELGGKLLNSLRIETQFLERLQSVSVVDGAAHTQKGTLLWRSG